MSDLNDKEAAQTVKLTGANSLGAETNFLAVDSFGNLQIDIARDETADILGVGITGARNNQIEISFNVAFDASLINNTQSGGGNATITNGHAIYSSGTNATASTKGVSVKTVIYRPAHELYSCFSCAFTTPTSVNSNQRIGLFDLLNGFYIGYNGLTFGVTKRSNGVETFTSKSSFNFDTLTGAVGSKFTRNGAPEPIDFTKSNLFRIRFAWLGSANILFEVYSPDGEWIVFHDIRQPNSDFNPSITNPNLPMQIEITKASGDATNLLMATACWGAGTTSDLSPLNQNLTDTDLATLTRSVISGRSSQGGGTYYNVKVTPSGSLITAIGDISDVDGQNPMATSFPVVIASDQSPVDIGVILGDQYTPQTPDTGTSQTKLLTDPDQQLKIRGNILSDEGTFRDDYSGNNIGPDYTVSEIGTASISLANSFLTLATGTASGATATVVYPGDYAPISLRTNFSVSQRLATQNIQIGMADDPLAPSIGAYFLFTGTLNNQVQCITQFSDTGYDTQTTLVTYFNGTTSAQDNEYYIEVQPDKVSFLINQQEVAQHRTHIPGPYDSLDFIASVQNTNTATNTNLVIDYIYLINQNTIQVSNSFNGDSLPIRQKTGYLATYSAAIPNFTYAALGTDIFTITGSDSKVVKIKHISVDGNAQTTVTRTITLLKRSSPNIGGLSTILTNVPWDSSNPAGTATVRYYSTNPGTLGTLIGSIHNEKLVLAASGSNTIEDKLDYSTIEASTMQDITLRSSQELLAINLNGVTTTNNTMNIDVTWTEE